MLVVSKINNSLFFLVSTFQKFPRILLFFNYVSFYFTTFFFSCLLLTVFASSLFMFNSMNVRTLLAFSSVGGNSWFLISSLCGLDFFYLFFVVYTSNFFLILLFLGGRFKLSSSMSFPSLVLFFGLLISIGGFPPFPPFFMKLYMLYIISYSSFFSFSLVLFFLVSVVYMLSSYMRFSLSYYINLFSSSISFILL